VWRADDKGVGHRSSGRDKDVANQPILRADVDRHLERRAAQKRGCR
jgi:hypothetical protein